MQIASSAKLTGCSDPGCGCFAAPEVISQGNTGNYDGKAVDVWACGVMLFVMLFCQYPFERPEDEQEKIQTKRYQMVSPYVSAAFRTSSRL